MPEAEINAASTKVQDKKYVEINDIQTDGGIFRTPQKLLNGMKKKATELKAHAVINIKYNFQACYTVVSETAIKYTDK